MQTTDATSTRRYLATGVALLGLVVLTGCPGFDLSTIFPIFNPPTTTQPTTKPPLPTPASAPGLTGIDASAGLPGTVVTIQNVFGAAMTQGPAIGDAVGVKFTLKTRSGSAIPPTDLNRFSIYISGPSTHYQRVIPAESDITKIKVETDGTYSYTFAKPFPSTFAAPLNDSAAFGAADGELAGTAIPAGTYTVGIEARRLVLRGDTQIQDAGDAQLDFVIGGATLAHREVVLQENCMACHGQFSIHGGNRFSLNGCVLCHTDGSEDRINSDPAKATPGVTIQLAHMIHAIHKGIENPMIVATAKGSDPYRYKIIGFGNSVLDFSTVQYPYMPGGTGFNQQTRNCGTCHDGAAQGDRAYTNPSRAACTGCHTDIDWTTGTALDDANSNVIAGTLTQADLSSSTFRKLIGGFAHSFTDSECTLCHKAGTALDPKTVHVPVLADPANLKNPKIEIMSVTGNTGAGFFQANDRPVVQFNIVDGSNNTINISEMASMSLVLSGPVENYQRIFPISNASSTVTVKGAGGVPTSGTGPFTFTSTLTIPSTVPVPFNDSTNYIYADGWGELSGQPLPIGSYTLAMWGYRNVVSNNVTYREVTPLASYTIAIGAAGHNATYPGFVTDAKCNTCHGDLRFHGNGRKGVAGCVLCHVGGGEDKATPATGQTQDPGIDSIDFKIMIHQIHNARNLNVVKDGGKYDLIGFGNNVIDFSNAGLPYLVGESKNCTACHATDAWKAPVVRDDVSIYKVACTSCHDSASAMIHVQLNTVPGTLKEACETCHGEGRLFSIESSHRLP